MHQANLFFKRAAGKVAIACVAGLMPLVAFAANSSAAPARSAVATGAQPCTTSGLVVWLDTHGSGTAGGTYYYLELTNLSGHVCTLVGYPGVSAVNLAGHQLGSAASRNAVGTPKVVTLQSATTATGLPPIGIDATATVVLKITDVGVYSPTRCAHETAAGLRVYPPDQTTSRIIPFPFVACSRSGPVFLTVEAVEKYVSSG